MNLLRPLKGLMIRLRSDGIRGTAQGIRDGFIPRNWRIYRLNPPVPEGLAQCEIGSDLAVLHSARSCDPGLPGDFYRDAANRSKQCFYARIDNQLAGIVWIYDTDYPSRVIRLAPGEVEIAFVFVMPEFRGRGIAKDLIRAACLHLLDRGVRIIYAVIEEHNLASQAAFTGCRFEWVGFVRRALLFGKPYVTPVGRTGKPAC
jgi:ribosomal protein S18 acetylase RimI-like enzyme